MIKFEGLHLIWRANLWVLPAEGYGLWVIMDVWVMVCNSLRTELVDGSRYGIQEVMGYQEYGLQGVRLYILW